MNRNKLKIKIPILITIAIVFICLFISFFYTRVTNATHKQALFLMMNDLSINDSQLKFEEIFNKYKTEKLKLNKLERNQWLITMPYEFGATDWQLWIAYENDKIKELKVRLSDSIDMHPYDAPPDKIKE